MTVLYERMLQALADFRVMAESGASNDSVRAWFEVRGLPFSDLSEFAEIAEIAASDKTTAFVCGLIVGWQLHADTLARESELPS